jgi:transcriptional regulator with XRE-family HTH domain
MTPRQCKAARALLGWGQPKLAGNARVGLSTVADFERDARQPKPASLARMRVALERGGVEFIDGKRPGVRMK